MKKECYDFGYGKARVSGKAWVSGEAWVFGNQEINR